MEKEDLDFIQTKINYQFSNPKLLEQAFTTKAFSVKNPERRDYELLEFFGDKILDFVLSKEYASYFCSLQDEQLFSEETECSLTQRNSALIRNENLAERIELLNFKEFFQKLPDEKIPKKREADLVESILGAVAVDSDWDTESLARVVDAILDPISDFKKNTYAKENFIMLLEKLCQKSEIKITAFQIASGGEENFRSKITLKYKDFQKTFTQKGKSEIGAKLSAARSAYIYAKKFWLFQAVEEWIENPVSQLNSLRQNKWILSVHYAINREDSSKNTSSCTCTVECPKEKTLVVSVEKASQKKAKNAAALKALSIILNQIKEESDSRGKGLLRLILEKYY